MAVHSSATPRAEKSHTLDASLKRRARLLITNSSIPAQTRSLIRYALEIKDPYLGQMVHRGGRKDYRSRVSGVTARIRDTSLRLCRRIDAEKGAILSFTLE